MMPLFQMPEFAILFAVSLLFCCIGFKRFVWFMSVGYGLSAAGIGLALFVLTLVRGESSAIYLIECVLLMVYGVRLGGFLLARELKNKSYQKKMDELGMNTKTPIFVSAFMWLFCGFLYICQTAPACYRLINGFASKPNAWAYVGALVSVLGIVLEASSDKQKSAQKAKNPGMPAMEGLFRLCRCPNYFGEILFWTGVFLSGIGAVQGAQWIIAVTGYIAIVFIMFSGAKRLEKRHIKNYGAKPEYNAYADKTPIIIPFLPLYHMVTPEDVKKEEEKKGKK